MKNIYDMDEGEIQTATETLLKAAEAKGVGITGHVIPPLGENPSREEVAAALYHTGTLSNPSAIDDKNVDNVLNSPDNLANLQYDVAAKNLQNMILQAERGGMNAADAIDGKADAPQAPVQEPVAVAPPPPPVQEPVAVAPPPPPVQEPVAVAPPPPPVQEPVAVAPPPPPPVQEPVAVAPPPPPPVQEPVAVAPPEEKHHSTLLYPEQKSPDGIGGEDSNTLLHTKPPVVEPEGPAMFNPDGTLTEAAISQQKEGLASAPPVQEPAVVTPPVQEQEPVVVTPPPAAAEPEGPVMFNPDGTLTEAAISQQKEGLASAPPVQEPAAVTPPPAAPETQTPAPKAETPSTPAPPTAEPAADNGAPPAPAAEDRAVRQGNGMKGAPDPKVMEMQALLRDAGFGDTLGNWGANHDGIDGRFGNDTLATVKAAQKALGLEENGIYNPDTMEAGLKDLAAKRQQETAKEQAPQTGQAQGAEPPATPAPEPATEPNFTPAAPPVSWMEAQPDWMQPPEAQICSEAQHALDTLQNLPPEVQQQVQTGMEQARGDGASHEAYGAEGPATQGVNQDKLREQELEGAGR